MSHAAPGQSSRARKRSIVIRSKDDRTFIPVVVALPDSLPIAIPNRVYTTRNSLYIEQNPMPSSNTRNKRLLIMNSYFRLQLSAARPDMMLPTKRSMRSTVSQLPYHLGVRSILRPLYIDDQYPSQENT